VCRTGLPCNRISAHRADSGHFNFHSQYGLYTAVLNSAPSQIGWPTAEPEAAARLALVLIKASMCKMFGKGELYSFRTDYIRGFQLGGESQVHKTIYAFDASDRGYEIVIIGSEEEIDYMLSSVRINEQESHSPE